MLLHRIYLSHSLTDWSISACYCSAPIDKIWLFLFKYLSDVVNNEEAYEDHHKLNKSRRFSATSTFIRTSCYHAANSCAKLHSSSCLCIWCESSSFEHFFLYDCLRLLECMCCYILWITFLLCFLFQFFIAASVYNRWLLYVFYYFFCIHYQI